MVECREFISDEEKKNKRKEKEKLTAHRSRAATTVDDLSPIFDQFAVMDA